MQEAGGDGISNAVNGKGRRGSTSKKERTPFEETEQRNLDMRGKQDNYVLIIIAVKWNINTYDYVATCRVLKFQYQQKFN